MVRCPPWRRDFLCVRAAFEQQLRLLRGRKEAVQGDDDLLGELRQDWVRQPQPQLVCRDLYLER